VVYVDANGREIANNPAAKPAWSLPLPPKTPAGAQPPALQGTVTNGVLSLAPIPSQQGYLDFVDGDLKARVRVRVAAGTSYKQDFEKLPAGAAPGGWVNATGKFIAKKMPDGTTVLAKVNTDARPPLARANAYITGPEASDYTIQADVMGTTVRNRQADAGIVNSRYTLVLTGTADPSTGKRDLRLQSWDGKHRVDVGGEVAWEPGAWYTLKLTVEPKEKTALIRAKYWKKGEAEPDKWTIEYEDPNPNRAGAAAIHGNVTNVTDEPGSEALFDNVVITPNSKK
jgi:hypothetical protein